MDKTKIWKFPFGDPIRKDIPWEFSLKTPHHTQHLHFGFTTYGAGIYGMCMWGRFLTENENTTENQHYYVVPTGVDFAVSGDYLESVIEGAGAINMVFHIFKGPVFRNG